MLNCFKHYKRCNLILYYILDFVQQEKTKFTMEQPFKLPILYCQYHACWRPGDIRSQGINRHSIDQYWPNSRDISSLASEELNANLSIFLFHGSSHRGLARTMGPVTSHSTNHLCQHWVRPWLITCLTPGHHLNHWTNADLLVIRHL